MMPRTPLAILTILFTVLPAAVAAQFDDLGNHAGQGGHTQDPQQSVVETCGECKEPDVLSWGVAFRGSYKWVVDVRGTLFRMRGCDVITEIPLVTLPLPAGLGYDSHRDVFILTDAALDRVYQVTTSGRILRGWPTPGPGPVGAAYDSRRDLYWFSDWERDQLNSIDPNTGLPGPSIDVPAGSRISGTAYDAVLDVLVYHSRDEALTYWMSVETEEIVAVYPIPRGGRNNGAGAGVDPRRGNLWLTHNEESLMFCQRGLSGGSGVCRPRDRRDRGFEDLVRVDDAAIPAAPVLGAAFPNPFNPVTRIRYVLPADGFVDLSVFDARGKLVETLVSGTQNAGGHTVEWMAHGAASGVYFYRLAVEGFSQTRKVILLK
jgi:hypothetical protein